MRSCSTNDSAALLPQAWTLSLEAGFYVLLPLALVACLRWRSAQIPLILTLIAVGLYWRLFSGLPLTPLSFVDQFAYGMLAAVAVARGVARSRIFPVAGIAIVVGSMFTGPVDRHWLPTSTIFAVGSALILAWVAATPGLRVARPFVFLGSISYGVFIWHYPLMTYLDAHGLRDSAIEARLPAILVGSLVLGTLSWMLVERRALGARRRLATTLRQVRQRLTDPTVDAVQPEPVVSEP